MTAVLTITNDEPPARTSAGRRSIDWAGIDRELRRAKGKWATLGPWRSSGAAGAHARRIANDATPLDAAHYELEVRKHNYDDFVTYVNRFAGDSTIAYVDVERPAVHAHLNDHMPVEGDTEVPGWADWRATLAWRTTLAWQHWTKHDRQMLSQEAFAEHIEEGLRSIVTPDAATLLEIAQTFKAEVSAQVAQARRLQSGEVQFTWNESIDARAGRDGMLTIPDRIELVLAPFEGAERIVVEARLRFRLSGGSDRRLTIGYLLDNPQQILRDAVDREVAALRAQLHPAVTVVYGTRGSRG